MMRTHHIMQKKIHALGLAFISTFCIQNTVSANLLKVDNGNFVDATGAKIVLRGFNLSQWHKKPPFRPNQDPALFPKLSQMGVNIVRLQFNWEAYELSPGVYDETYLNYYVDIVNRASNNKIHVLIDIHQDSFSRWSLDGCGEGFPKWATELAGGKISTPDNGSKCWMWPIRAFLQQSSLNKMFNNLYTMPQLRDHYFQMLENIAKRVNNNPYVVGYDILNEPWGDNDKLISFYQQATQKVRAYHPDAIIFVDHVMLQGDGTSAITLTNPNIPNMAFAHHYYDTATAFLSMPYLQNFKAIGATRRNLAKKWGAANFMGEFGAVPSLFSMPYMDAQYGDMDAFGDSGTQWAYTPEWDPVTKDGFNMEDLSVIDNTGKHRANYRDRPYIQRTAGTQSSLKVNYAVLRFGKNGLGAAWDNVPSIGSTRIFIPTNFIAKANATITTTGGAYCVWAGEQLLDCQSNTTGIKTVSLSKR